MTTDLLRWRKESHQISPLLWAGIATKAGTTPAYLDQLAYGYSQCSPRLAGRIADAMKLIDGITPVSREAIVFGKK